MLRMHHVGYVVASLEASVHSVARSLHATWDGKIFEDPHQVVRVTFLKGYDSHDPLVELVQPHGTDSPVAGFLNRGGGLHHLCYEVESLERALEASREAGGKIVRPPLPAVAFGGRRIAWVFTKNRLLVELLERVALPTALSPAGNSTHG